MFNKYYEDELGFLREMGAEFARAHPAAAPYLGERGADPDVERMLEGFAFLTGKLRQKLDDELPELTQSLMQMLWPHYLRPIPSMSILQLEPVPHLVREAQQVPRGTLLDSVPVDGTPCRFQTCYDVQVLPLQIESAVVDQPAGTSGHLRLGISITQGADPAKVQFDRLRFYLHGEPTTCHALYHQLSRRLSGVVMRRPDATQQAGLVRLPPENVKPAGFAQEESLLPYPPHAFPGYRLLQEYFALPQKFLFFDVTGLPELSRIDASNKFEIILEFTRPPEGAIRVNAENVRLHCTPVVNLVAAQSDPIRVDHQKVEYPIRPGTSNPAHFEVFSVDKVKGWLKGATEENEYPSFHSFRQGEGGAEGASVVYYYTRLRNSVLGPGVDTYISFVTAHQEKAMPEAERMVADLTCTNGPLTGGLRIGDINKPTSSTPGFVKFRNITAVTEPVTPPLGGGLHWRMISNMSLNYLSLASPEALRGILNVYNFQALQKRQAARENELRLGGIEAVRSIPEERLYRGAPIRGRRIEIDMREENFAGEGGMLLFANVLDEFLSLYCTVNSFTRLVIRGVQQGETYEWNPKTGQQALV
jgi:type VI secretion system protein ImpG